jgi:hypothetical protein
MKLTLQQYFNEFNKLPILLKIIPASPLTLLWPKFYPPVAQEERMLSYSVATGFCVALAVLLAFIFSGESRKVRTKLYIALIAAFVIAFSGYLMLNDRYVFSVSFPGEGEQRVSIGYARTTHSLTVSELQGKGDYELLTKFGASEEYIEKVWTRCSISTVRFLLFATYTVSLVCAAFLAGLVVYQSAATKKR